LKHPSYEFVDSAFGALSTRNNIIKTSEIPANIKRVSAVQSFTTYFRYTRSLLDHVYRNKTVKGYVGPSYADCLPLDFDSPDLNLSLGRARKAVEFVLGKGTPDEDVKVYFSGAKGFHICLASSLFDLEPTNALAEVYKAMAKALSKDMGIDLDPTIYDGMRLFRLENTLNSKSQLYKIPLTIEELFSLSVEEIKELAKQPRVMSYPVRNGVVNDYFMSLFLSALDATEKKQTVKLSNNKEVTLSNRNAKPCIARLLAGVGEGERNNAAMRLAVHYKKEGMPENVCLGLLQGWNESNDPPLPDFDLENVIHSAYSGSYDFGCHDPLLSSNCGPECALHQRKAERGVKSKDLIPLGSLVESYVESLRTTGRVYLGIPEVDKATRGNIPGEVIILMSRPSVGKTSLMLHTLFRKPAEIPAIFFSLEMPSEQIFERAAEIVTGLPAEDLEELVKDPEQRVEVAKAVAQKFTNVLIIDKDALFLKDVESYIDAAEKEIFHQKARWILIDHLGRMRAKGHKEYEVISELARQMKQLAKSRGTTCYVAVQVGREEGGDGTQELTLSSARGSGQIEEGADVLLGMWRPDLNDESRDWDDAVVAVLKNRRGPRARALMRFHRSTLTFEPVPKSARNSKAKVDI
jgi:hypothetical protein